MKIITSFLTSILLLPCATLLYAQRTEVRGVVQDEDGKGIGNVKVMLSPDQGANFVYTGNEGNFTLIATNPKPPCELIIEGKDANKRSLTLAKKYTINEDSDFKEFKKLVVKRSSAHPAKPLGTEVTRVTGPRTSAITHPDSFDIRFLNCENPRKHVPIKGVRVRMYIGNSATSSLNKASDEQGFIRLPAPKSKEPISLLYEADGFENKDGINFVIAGPVKDVCMYPIKGDTFQVFGRVMDTEGNPLEGVEITQNDGSYPVTTRDYGWFFLKLPSSALDPNSKLKIVFKKSGHIDTSILTKIGRNEHNVDLDKVVLLRLGERKKDSPLYNSGELDGYVWLRENLKEHTANSEYFDVKGIKGYWYTWQDALNACPKGWALPYKIQLDNIIEQKGEMYVRNFLWPSRETKSAAKDAPNKDFGEVGYFWLADEVTRSKAYFVRLDRDGRIETIEGNKDKRMSCRCVRRQ